MVVENNWAVGFLFRNDQQEVALIKKTHPLWQAGKLNGPGGSIEKGESPLGAIQREFSEEAGVMIEDWREFALLKVQNGEVHFFVAHGNYEIRSNTDETVQWYKVSDIKNLPTLDNLQWLIPLALDPGNKQTVVEYYQKH